MDDHKLFKINQNAVIRDSFGKILILKKEGKWMLPGGRMENDKDPILGLRREVKEETGIESLTSEKILSVDLSDSGQTYTITFLCKTINDPVIILSSEHEGYDWVNKETINNYVFWHEKIKEILSSVS